MSRCPKTTARHIAWWSAEFVEVTGQAIITARVVNMLEAAGGQGVVYPPGRGLRSALSWLIAAIRLWKLALFGRAKRIYLVCSRSNGGFLRDLPAYLLALLGSRVVVHTHGSDIVDLCRRPWIGIIARFFLSHCLLVLPSAHLASPLRELGINNIYCCENFYEPFTGPVAAHSPASEGVTCDVTVLWNSNIMASKGFFVLADAVSRLNQQGYKACLTAIGRCIGDELMNVNVCEARLVSLQRETWFSYRGPVSRSESTRLLGQADVVCLPSSYASECQPLAIIEAMCAARPIIIANTAALRATVGDYPCLVVEVPVQMEALAEAILLCRKHKCDDALVDAAQTSRKRFSPDRFDHEMCMLLGLHHDDIGT